MRSIPGKGLLRDAASAGPRLRFQVMRSGLLGFLAFALGLAAPVRALVHSVTDFRLDNSGSASDTAFLDPTWGDSLLLNAQDFEYKSVLTARLNNAFGNNGVSGASPVATATGLYTFKAAYLSWSAEHTPGTAPTGVPPRANISTRIIDLSPDTAAISTFDKVIAGQENTPAVSPPWAGYASTPPPPSYLSFSASGQKYAAYWGSLTPNGPIRRVSHRDTAGLATVWGKYVTPTAPVLTGGYGKVSSAPVPGSGGSRTILAYETSFAAKTFDIRWEDIDAGTSTAVAVTASVFPEDFALAADSAGNVVVLWRENADLWAVGYDSSRTQAFPPTLVQTGIFFKEGAPEHYHRPYAAASLSRARFALVYGRAAGGNNVIYSRNLDFPFGAQAFAVSGETAITGPTDYSMFPDIAATPDRAVVAWFQRTSTPGVFRLMGSILKKAGGGAGPYLTLTERVDLDFAGENISFEGIGGNWYPIHWFRSASVAMDPKGNVLAAYDNGYDAKVALVRNTPIYYDSGAFVSRTIAVANPDIPSFAFNPASDSVVFTAMRPVATDTARMRLLLAASPDGTFGGSGSAFLPLASPRQAAAGFFRYRVEMLTTKPANLTTPKLKSLEIDYNVKPRTPRIDSIRIGSGPWAAFNSSAAYAALPRKDSLHLVCSGFDADDNGLEFRISLGGFLLKSSNGERRSAGDFRAGLSLALPDTVLDPLPLVLATVDQDGWASRPFGLSLAFRNIIPTQTITVFRNRGRDSASVYLPYGGGTDTLIPSAGTLIVMQSGDSLAVTARHADGNDDTVSASWSRNAATLGAVRVPVGDTLRFRFAPDGSPPDIDTLIVRVGDKDTTVAFRIPVRANRTPSIDSVFHASYRGADSLWKNGPFDKVKDFAADTGLVIPSGLATALQAGASDPDLALGDSLRVEWAVWRRAGTCPAGDLSCYQKADSAQGAVFNRVFQVAEEYLTVRVTDGFGAFAERKLRLEYPVLDTSGAVSFSAAVKTLSEEIDFILDSRVTERHVRVEIASKGSAPLRILSVATLTDNRQWLDVRLGWLSGSPPRPDSARFEGPTNVNVLTAGRSVSLAPGESLAFDFRFNSLSLRGDSVLSDTLLVQTSDFSNPILKIPFRLVYNDLPAMKLGVPGSAAVGGPEGYNAAGLPALIPARSVLAITFTETVRVPDPASVFRVYSYLDSLKNPSGYRPIPGVYEYRRKATAPGKVSASGGASALAKASAPGDSLADSILFTPRYDRPSDSLKVMPAPGYFIYRDILHIAVSNAITDLAGNGLDLRLDRAALAAGSFDTVFSARVDTGVFMVASTRPSRGEVNWSPEEPIRVRFNRKLSRRPPLGTDTVTLLDLVALKADSNRSIRVTSVFRPGQPYDFRFLGLENGDSTLVILTRPRLPALDTVTLTLSGGILDTSGLSLDGNGDKIPEWLYTRSDSADSYSISFMTMDADFYVFPNPFRHSDARHRDKASITFKNLNSLKGFILGSEVVLRIHTMSGDLVYNSQSRPDPFQSSGNQKNTSLDWDLRNTSGAKVGTGVYIYTLTTGKSRLLRKGKVAVVR